MLSGAATAGESPLLPSLFILFIELSHGDVSPAGESQRPRLQDPAESLQDGGGGERERQKKKRG